MWDILRDGNLGLCSGGRIAVVVSRLNVTRVGAASPTMAAAAATGTGAKSFVVNLLSQSASCSSSPEGYSRP